MMKSLFIKYLRNLLIFSAILGSMALILYFIIPKSYFSPTIPFLFGLFMATSLLSFYYLVRSTEKRFIKFVNTFLLTIIFKLFIYAGVMISYAFMNRRDAVPFMLGFFILYLFYTIFETLSIIQYTRPSEQGNNNQ